MNNNGTSGGGGNGMLTGVLLGQAMSNHGNRDQGYYNQSSLATPNAGLAQGTHSSGMGFFGFLMLFVVLAGLGFLAYKMYNARIAKKAQEQLTKGRYTL